MSVGEVRKAVEEGNRKFGAAVQRKNYAELASLYTNDAKVLAPDAPIVTGRRAIENFWRDAASALGLVGATLKTLDLEVSEDTAYEVGQADLKVSSGHATVKYMVVWRRGDDGAWQLHRDIWNSMPAG
jgi:ketosteroid isomerase-like protein